MSEDATCERCGAIADVELDTTVTPISARAEQVMPTPRSQTVLMCMTCIAEIGPDIKKQIETPPVSEPEGQLQ